MVLNGIKKEPRYKLYRLPLTQEILRPLFQQLKDGCFGKYLDLLLATMLNVGYYGLFRCGELLCESQAFDPKRDLTLSDISVHSFNGSPSVTIHLKTSKTDTSGLGTDVYLFNTGQDLCPVTYVLAYLKVISSMGMGPQEPFFIMPDRSAMTRSKYLEMLHHVLKKIGIDPSGYSGHSLRKGGGPQISTADIYLTLLLEPWDVGLVIVI